MHIHQAASVGGYIACTSFKLGSYCDVPTH